MAVDRNIKIPLYQQISEKISNDISSNKYSSGELLPSERELSEIFSVDRITIRKALDSLVDNNLVEKIPGVGTRIKLIQQPTNNGVDSKNILFALPKSINMVDRITEPFNANLFYSTEKECKKNGFTLIYTTISESDSLNDVLRAKSVSGIIFVSEINVRIFEEALRLNIPMILVNKGYKDLAYITLDNETSSYQAVKYLLEMGHKKIAFIGGVESYSTSQERFSGYKKGLAEANIDLIGKMIKSGDWTFEGGYKAMKDILVENANELPTAVFAANDHTAFGAIKAIREQNLSVPDDISIIGFDDLPQCEYFTPHLTTIRTDINLLAKTAMRSLFNSIESQETLMGYKLVISTKLIIRDSVKKMI